MTEAQTKPRMGLMTAVYLLGLLVGGLYVGMVSPARTVVQEAFGLDSAAGIWMVNIYTLVYAASIPATGKLADRLGRNRAFTACMGLFCAGSVLCGLAQFAGGYPMLLTGRVVQALGAGGVIPIATAEMGTSFPPERRGMALGLTAAVAGISNVLGAAVGSLLLGLAGEDWGMLFFACVPVCLALVVAAALWLPNRPCEACGRLDLAGSALFALFAFMLLLGIMNLDFFNLGATLLLPGSWVPLVASAVLLCVLVAVERRADDPVLNFSFFSNRRTLVTMAIAFFVGGCIVSTVLIPQFAEEAFGLPAGKGGYYVMAFGVCALVGPPMGGKLIDRFGAKPVLGAGLAVAGAGFAFLALVTAAAPTPPTMVAGLAIMGAGMGFVMGAPLNYMMLQNTAEAQSTSAVATLSLVRQVGTTLAPALLVGFLVQGLGMVGYRWMFLCLAGFCAASLMLLAAYREPARQTS